MTKWKKVQNAVLATTPISRKEHRSVTLQIKDYSNSQALIQWLEVAKKDINERYLFIKSAQAQIFIYTDEITELQQKNNEEKFANLTEKIEEKTQEVVKLLKENDFLEEELEKLESKLFLEVRKAQLDKIDDQEAKEKQQLIINELEITLKGRESEIEKLRNKIRTIKANEKQFFLPQLAPRKKSISNNMKAIAKYLTNTKQKWADHLNNNLRNEKDYGENEQLITILLPLAEQALQNPDDKEGYQKLKDAWDSGVWKGGSGDKYWFEYYFSNWGEPEWTGLTPEQEQKLNEYDTLKQKVETLEKQGGGTGVDDKGKQDLEKMIDDLRTASSIDDDKLTNELSLGSGNNWRTWLKESPTSYELTCRYGKIAESISLINSKKEKEVLEKENEEWKKKEKDWEYELTQKDEELEKKKQKIEDLLKPPTVPPTPKTPAARQEEAAQTWLENNYGKNKNNVFEIEVDELTAKTTKLMADLEIEDYPSLTSIFLSEMGITKLTIKNCPKVEEINILGNEITEIVGLDKLTELKRLICSTNQISEIDVSNNLQLSQLETFENPNLKIVGLKNLSMINEYKSDDSESLNIVKIVEEEWEEAAKRLNIDEQKLKNKTLKEIKKLIQEEGEMIKENENKINDLQTGLPNLLIDRKIDDNELIKIKKKISEADKLKKDLEDAIDEKDQVRKEKKEVQQKLVSERERAEKDKKLITTYEKELRRKAGQGVINQLRAKVEQETLQANIEANKN